MISNYNSLLAVEQAQKEAVFAEEQKREVEEAGAQEAEHVWACPRS
jgi:hypothetical protein